MVRLCVISDWLNHSIRGGKRSDVWRTIATTPARSSVVTTVATAAAAKAAAAAAKAAAATTTTTTTNNNNTTECTWLRGCDASIQKKILR